MDEYAYSYQAIELLNVLEQSATELRSIVDENAPPTPDLVLQVQDIMTMLDSAVSNNFNNLPATIRAGIQYLDPEEAREQLAQVYCELETLDRKREELERVLKNM